MSKWKGPRSGSGKQYQKLPNLFKCSCKHADQDEINGPGIRNHSPCKPKSKNDGGTYWRCSVCLDVKFIPGKKKEAPKKKDGAEQEEAATKAGKTKSKKR